MKDTKKPKIRFKEFNDSWEQRKLSDEVSSIDTGKSKFDAKESGDYEILGSTGVIGYDDSFDYEGDFLLTARVGANAGTLYRHLGKVKITDNTVFLQGSHIDFVFYLLDKFDLKKMSFGSGQPLIKASELKCLELMMPVQNEEKEKIATYFLNLYNLITLHQRECEKLLCFKKSMLEKMFPKNGEKYPEIRFSGFTDSWEQRKLSEMVGMTYGGGTPSTTNDTFWYGDIPWIQSSNVVEGELFNIDIKKHISREGLNHSAAQLIPENSVAVVTHVGVGKLVFMRYSYATSQDFISLGDMKCEPRFLCYALYKRLQEDLHIVQGSAIKGITKEDLMSKVISVPQITEQTKISNTLQGLDHLITLHQREIKVQKRIKLWRII